MNFVVVGAGAWGTAFALHLARAGHPVALVPRRPEHAAALTKARENADYLPGVMLPASVEITSELGPAVTRAQVLLLACPAQALRSTCAKISESIGAGAVSPELVISLAKGLEAESHLRPSEVISAVLPGIPVGSLSGPTNAAEVARGLPAAMVLAAVNFPATLTEVQAAISGASLRVYTSDDLAGVEYGASLKNIYAIAAGCCEGLRLGDNARASLLTRALTEMVRVGAALGARPETFYGLSGFGDLVATCHGEWSRNRALGQQIGEGHAVADLVTGRKTVVEGYKTTEAFAGLCAARGIDAPILREIHAILFASKKPAAALASLMGRELKRETIAPMLTAANRV